MWCFARAPAHPPAGLLPGDRRKLQPTRNQERYRTAGRVLQERADRRVLAYATGGASAARRAPQQPPSGGTKHYHPPAGLQPGDRRKLQPTRNQERYRTAGRVLQARADRRVLAYATGGASAARRAPAKRDRSVLKNGTRRGTRTLKPCGVGT